MFVNALCEKLPFYPFILSTPQSWMSFITYLLIYMFSEINYFCTENNCWIHEDMIGIINKQKEDQYTTDCTVDVFLPFLERVEWFKRFNYCCILRKIGKQPKATSRDSDDNKIEKSPQEINANDRNQQIVYHDKDSIFKLIGP
jgi:hypothetical protein